MIKNLDDGTSTTATVAGAFFSLLLLSLSYLPRKKNADRAYVEIDSCPSCGNENNIDLSVGAFKAIDPQYATHGVRNIQWWFTD